MRVQPCTVQNGLQSRRRLNHYQMVFQQAIAKSSTKVMEFTLMFRAESFCRAQQFGLGLDSVDQSNVASVMGHL